MKALWRVRGWQVGREDDIQGKVKIADLLFIYRGFGP